MHFAFATNGQHHPLTPLYYKLALGLNPNLLSDRYNLGLLYENLPEPNFIRDRAEYQKAIDGKFAKAYNNMARLEILDKNYPAAVSLIEKGLKLAREEQVKYSRQKNLGWAKLGQSRYESAKIHLQKAIALDGLQAAAHCLLAQVLQHQGDNRGTLGSWKNCQKYANPQNPDEKIWINMIPQQLKTTTQAL